MLAPDRSRTVAQIDHLIVANTEAVAWCKAITDAVLPPMPSSAPEWYADAQAKLSAAVADAHGWVLDCGPRLFADCLQSHLTFANLFCASAERLKGPLAAARARGGALTGEERDALHTLLTELLAEAKDQHATIRSHRDRLEAFRRRMDAHSGGLRPILARIKTSDAAEQKKTDEILGRIASLREELAVVVAAQKSSTDSTMKGSAKSVYALTFGLWWATGALSGSAVVGFAMLGYEAYKLKSLMVRYRKTFAEITTLTNQLGDIGLQVVAMSQVDSLLAQIEDKNQRAATGIESVDLIWSHLIDKLQTACEIVSQPIADIDAYGDLRSLEFAAKSWQGLAQDAADRQSLKLEVQTMDLGR
ncbi:hypothetical protein SAMN04487844_12211 [Methylobacterium sp. yr596]|jgi:hypothetical protein|nr:hypothetical protein SAMN04487844_12211 [Methylobacterium sp. yr596]